MLQSDWLALARPTRYKPRPRYGALTRRLSNVEFQLLGTSAGARRGRMSFAGRGVVETPAFMPVGTYGSVKAISPEEVRDSGAQILLGNTFHLMLRPGDELMKRLGGLHRFMNWSGPILTDSGGFQVWSLSGLRKITEEGVKFASPVNGDRLFLSPERSIEVQHALGSDIIMQFDECTPYPATEKQARQSMELSARWAVRCMAAAGCPDLTITDVLVLQQFRSSEEVGVYFAVVKTLALVHFAYFFVISAGCFQRGHTGYQLAFQLACQSAGSKMRGFHTGQERRSRCCCHQLVKYRRSAAAKPLYCNVGTNNFACFRVYKRRPDGTIAGVGRSYPTDHVVANVGRIPVSIVRHDLHLHGIFKTCFFKKHKPDDARHAAVGSE